jgi:hypothetical protein
MQKKFEKPAVFWLKRLYTAEEHYKNFLVAFLTLKQKLALQCLNSYDTTTRPVKNIQHIAPFTMSQRL